MFLASHIKGFNPSKIMNNQPFISIIIANYNGERYLYQCLNSIIASSFSDHEIIFVDDGSTNKSRKILENYQKNPQIKLIFQKENQGPAKARNKGAVLAQGKYLFFLDIDTEIEKDCLKTIVAKFEEDKMLGAIQTKLIQAKTGKMETAGHFLSFFGFPYEIGVQENSKNHNQERVIFGARSAAMAICKDVFEKISGFDGDYFIYGEDTDLSWRVWLAGYKVIFLPQSTVYHLGKSSLTEKTKYRIFYEGAKNNTMNLLKNAEFLTLLWILPLHILAWIFLSLKLISQRRLLMAVWIYRGLRWNLKNIRKTLMKRKHISSLTIENNQVMNIIFGSLNIRQLFLKGLQWFSRI